MDLTDIKLDNRMELTQAATGDAPTIQGTDCYLQGLKLEALTQAGELFYAPDFGWSLKDFLQLENTELTRMEIQNRIRSKLAVHPEIDKTSIDITIQWEEDTTNIDTRFKLLTGETLNITINMDRVEVTIT